MERVQEAIAKARAERQGQVGQPPRRPTPGVGGALGMPSNGSRPEPPASPFGQPDQAGAALPETDAAPAAAADKADLGQQITYTTTPVVPADEARLKENRVIAGFRHDPRVEVYRQLRSKVLMQMKANGWKTLAITSPGEGAGKSLTAANLAISLSQEVNQTVLLVDLDLRSPSLHERLGIEVKTGLADCLLEGLPIASSLVNPGFSRLVVLPGRAQDSYSSELLTSPRMKALLNDITHRYEARIIVFDLPPLLRNDDALVFTPQVDATLLVVEDGVTTPEQVERSRHLLKHSNHIGTLLNKARD